MEQSHPYTPLERTRGSGEKDGRVRMCANLCLPSDRFVRRKCLSPSTCASRGRFSHFLFSLFPPLSPRSTRNRKLDLGSSWLLPAIVCVCVCGILFLGLWKIGTGSRPERARTQQHKKPILLYTGQEGSEPSLCFFLLSCRPTLGTMGNDTKTHTLMHA